MSADINAQGADVGVQVAVHEPMAKLDLYAHLLTYDEPDATDTKAVGQLAQVSPKSVASMIGQLTSNPNVYQKLLNAGYNDAQVPGWVQRPVASAGEGGKRAPGAGGVLNMPEKSPRTPTLGKGSQETMVSNTQQLATARNTLQQGGTLSSEQLDSLDTEQLTQLGLIRDTNGQVYRIQPGQGGAYTMVAYVPAPEPTESAPDSTGSAEVGRARIGLKNRQ